MARRSSSWFGIGMSAYALGMESATVIALRTLKLSQGGAAAEKEAATMVQEKIAAAAALPLMAATGALGFTPHQAARKTLAHYRRKVSANRRRLSK
jgi:hypothetical protein